MSQRYSRVATRDAKSVPENSEDEYKMKRKELAERISNKLHAAFWVVTTCLLCYYTDLFRVLIEDKRVNRFWFNLAMICLGINTVLMLYLTLWLPMVKKITLPWDIYCPRVIPTATAVGIICGFSLNFALWSIWGFLTPLILLIVFMGFLFSLHFVPWPC